MCFCTPGIRTPFCSSPDCTKEEARIKALKGLRFEVGDEVIIKRHGAIISEGRVQEEIGDARRTAAVVKFEDGRWWGDIATTTNKLSSEDVGNLMKFCADNIHEVRARVLLKRLAELL